LKRLDDQVLLKYQSITLSSRINKEVEMATNAHPTQPAKPTEETLLTGMPQLIFYNANIISRNLRHPHARSWLKDFLLREKAKQANEPAS
jgi:hypothetical protein